MNPPTLEIAKCCGTCVWTNQKKRPQPEDHAAHYTVAKTERWCQKFNLPTVREAVCPDWELEPKKGGAPAVKRARRQNERLAAILRLKERLLRDKIAAWEGYKFKIENDYVVFCYPNSDNWYRVSCKSRNRFDEFLDKE